MVRAGLEPVTSGFRVRRPNYSATLPPCRINCRSRKALSTFLHCVAKVSAVLLRWQQRMFDVASRVQMFDVKRHAAEKIGAINRQGRKQWSHSLQSPDYHIDRPNGSSRNHALGSIQRHFGASLYWSNRVFVLREYFYAKSDLFQGLWQCSWWRRLSFLMH